jgi:hypothetical protein
MTVRAFSVPAIRTIQLEKLYGRRFVEINAKSTGNLSQRVIEMWQVIDGHVTNECAAHFVISHAAMHPSEKDRKLRDGGKYNDDPVGVHRGMVGRSLAVEP